MTLCKKRLRLRLILPQIKRHLFNKFPSKILFGQRIWHFCWSLLDDWLSRVLVAIIFLSSNDYLNQEKSFINCFLERLTPRVSLFHFEIPAVLGWYFSCKNGIDWFENCLITSFNMNWFFFISVQLRYLKSQDIAREKYWWSGQQIWPRELCFIWC